MEKILMMLVVTVLIVSTCSGTNTVPELMKEIGKGKKDRVIAELLAEMQRGAMGEIKAKTDHCNQYLLATRLNIHENGMLSIEKNKVKYYENINKRDIKSSDGLDYMGISGTPTKHNTVRNVENASNNAKIHTELQFIYAKHFQTELKEGGIFLIYSHFIPCSGLSQKASFGECAGDMAYYRKSHRNVHFVVMYSEFFAPAGDRTGSNEKLSKLYLALGGIPLLHCKSAEHSCSKNNSEQISMEKFLEDPFYQRFPRVFAKNQKSKIQIGLFVECLAHGNFIQYLTNLEPDLESIPQKDIDEILTEFVSEYFLANSGQVNLNDYKTIVMLAGMLRGKLIEKARDIIDKCFLFMDTQSEIKDQPLTPNAELRKRLRKPSIPRDVLCNYFGSRIGLQQKKKPDICMINNIIKH